MATEIIKQLIDDIDGGTAASTVSLSWQGVNYELDLSKKNATALEKALRPYLDHARKVRGSSRASGRGNRRATATSAGSANDIREWGRANGFEVSDRGRVPNSLVEAYNAAS